MNQLQLTKPWTQFKEELGQFIVQGKALKNLPVITPEHIVEMEDAISAWDKQVMQWLESSFNLPRNSYIITFHNVGANNFNTPNQNLGKDQQIVQLKYKLKQIPCLCLSAF
jgi:hypothetical protein